MTDVILYMNPTLQTIKRPADATTKIEVESPSHGGNDKKLRLFGVRWKRVPARDLSEGHLKVKLEMVTVTPLWSILCQ